MITEDWTDKSAPYGIGDEWISAGSHIYYSIYSAWLPAFGPEFRNRAQRVTRLTGVGGDIGILSNDFGLNSTSSNYLVEFSYRCDGGDLRLGRFNGLTMINLDGGSTPTYFSSTGTGYAVRVSATVIGNGYPFRGLVFQMLGGKTIGNAIWFELDRVSCREIL